ncbi:alpha/beta hydrolase [Leptospira sp. WS92.C1]
MKKFVGSSTKNNIPKSLRIPIGDSQFLAAEVYGPFPVLKSMSSPIFCIHGLTGNLKNFAPLARNLVKQGLTVITYDLRGRGKSSKPDITYSYDLHAEDLKKMIDHLKIPKVNLLAHSLGCWISLSFGKKFPERTDNLCLIDGGGKLFIIRKLSNLSMIPTSLQRLGKIFPNKKTYLKLAKESPILGSWNQDVKDFLNYELEEISDPERSSGYRCNIPRFVIHSELTQMGGAMSPWKIPLQFLKHPIQIFRIFKKNQVLPYSKIQSPVLIIRAGKSNFKKGDELLPDSAISIFQKELKRPVFLTLPDKNHYEVILLPDLKRDETIGWFFKNRK